MTLNGHFSRPAQTDPYVYICAVNVFYKIGVKKNALKCLNKNTQINHHDHCVFAGFVCLCANLNEVQDHCYVFQCVFMIMITTLEDF